MPSAVDTPTGSAMADDAMAFRHLLHEVASHVTGLGLTLEMFGEPGVPPEDTAAMVGTARGALDDLRYLIADIGELRRFLHKHGSVHRERVETVELLADLEKSGVRVAQTPNGVPAPPAVCADRAVIGFVLQLMARSCRRAAGVDVEASAVLMGGRFVRVEVWAIYDEATTGTRRSLEKAPMVVDHFCSAIARDLGGRFVREQSRNGQRVGFVLAVAS